MRRGGKPPLSAIVRSFMLPNLLIKENHIYLDGVEIENVMRAVTVMKPSKNILHLEILVLFIFYSIR